MLLVVPVEEIRGFVPASQVPGFPSGLSQEDRLERLSERVGDKLMVKVIEIDRRTFEAGWRTELADVPLLRASPDGRSIIAATSSGRMAVPSSTRDPSLSATAASSAGSPPPR